MTAIEFDNVSKRYRLGQVSSGLLCHDLTRFWQTKVLRRPDPYLTIGETNDRTTKGASDYVWALRDIDFSVGQGDVVGIIGSNGAGKSTLLKLLSRVTTPTRGTIRVRGRIASLLEVGTGFHPEMTGRENIYMNGSILGMTRAEITRKLDEIVDFSGCARYLDTPVKRYSSGMYVRLGFAIAAHLDPEILIVDEVLAVGDAEFQQKAVGKMREVARRQGRTILFVSHNMSAVRNLCTSGILLRNGEIAFRGTAQECIDRYGAANIAAFVTHKAVASDAREPGGSGEIVFDEVALANPSPSLATDEPIELRFRMRRCGAGVRTCTFTVTIDDEADQRILAYETDPVAVPQARDAFAVRLKLSNHGLMPRRYKIGMAVGEKGLGAGTPPYDRLADAPLRFEVKYARCGTTLECAYWRKDWGPILHRGENVRAEVERDDLVV